MEEKSPHQILADSIGRATMASALGVGKTAISNAVVVGSFPASWYVVLRSLAAEVGADCPPELFKMRMLDGSQSVDNERVCQPPGNNLRESAVK